MRLGEHGLYLPETEHDACGVGFVVHLKGARSHAIVEQGLEVLDRLSHRAACGRDPETGDGAGILIQLPHAFFAQANLPFPLPPRGRYAVAQVFLPPEPERLPSKGPACGCVASTQPWPWSRTAGPIFPRRCAPQGVACP